MGSRRDYLDIDEIANYIQTEPIPSDTESVDDLEEDEDINLPETNSSRGDGVNQCLDHDYASIRDMETIIGGQECEDFNLFPLSPITIPENPSVSQSPASSTSLVSLQNMDPGFLRSPLPSPMSIPGSSTSLTPSSNASSPLPPKEQRGEEFETRQSKRKRQPNSRLEKSEIFGPPVRPPPTWGCLEENIPSMSGTMMDYCGPAQYILSMENKTPKDLFKCMVDDGMIDHIVFQTNLYAEQSGKRYTPTNKTEMEVFLGINILMGIKRLPSYRDYWSSDPDLNDPFISKLMPVNRFSWFLGNLHLNDNAFLPQRGSPEYDKLYKLRPFLDAISDNFKKNFSPGQVLLVDESMIKFKGRSSLKQYLPKKPIKRGYKLWMLADKSGYVIKFDVYTGKVGEMRQYDLGPTVVKNLTEHLKDKHHTLYIDNYFVSYFLMEDLKSMNINACGTVQSGRKNLPPFKETKAMNRGDYDYRVSDNKVTAVKWIDNKPVLLLSNCHDPREVVTVRRRSKDGSRLQVSCPSLVQEYNMNMNCVDKFDQLKSVYEISRKSHKWWHRIFFDFIDAAIVNSFVVHNCIPTTRLDMKTFRRQVVLGLVGQRYAEATSSPGASPRLAHWKPRVPDDVRKTSSLHQPVRSTRRRCSMCSTKKNKCLQVGSVKHALFLCASRQTKTVSAFFTKENNE